MKIYWKRNKIVDQGRKVQLQVQRELWKLAAQTGEALSLSNVSEAPWRALERNRHCKGQGNSAWKESKHSYSKVPQPTDKSLVDSQSKQREQEQADSWWDPSQRDIVRQKAIGQNISEVWQSLVAVHRLLIVCLWVWGSHRLGREPSQIKLLGRETNEGGTQERKAESTPHPEVCTPNTWEIPELRKKETLNPWGAESRSRSSARILE